MARNRIHLAAPASPCADFLAGSGIETVANLRRIVQEVVGVNYEITADESLLVATENDDHGGRRDDARRAADISMALSDDRVVAVATIRGGAWLTRILPAIDFSVLERRSKPVAMFGFSEITPLVNLVGAYPMGRGIYDNSPAFLVYSLRHFARTRATSDQLGGLTPREWSKQRLLPEFQAYFRDLASIIEGRGSKRMLRASLVHGSLPDRAAARFVGGNLTVFATVAATPLRSIETASGYWIVLEDYNDKPSRLDRFLSILSLSGYFRQCEGILLGDFHKDDQDLSAALLGCLRAHLPGDREVPILQSRDFGHIWPMSPVPMHVDCTLERTGDANEYAITWPDAALRTVTPA